MISFNASATHHYPTRTSIGPKSLSVPSVTCRIGAGDFVSLIFAKNAHIDGNDSLLPHAVNFIQTLFHCQITGAIHSDLVSNSERALWGFKQIVGGTAELIREYATSFLTPSTPNPLRAAAVCFLINAHL